MTMSIKQCWYMEKLESYVGEQSKLLRAVSSVLLEAFCLCSV